MRWIELEIVVPAPPAETFPWVVEPGLLREWMPQLEELRPQGFLHHRPVVRHGALSFALDVRVHRVEVPRRLELDIAWRGAVARLHLEVRAHEDGATVTWRTGLELPPSLRLAGPATARELRRIMRRDLELLAERLGEPHPDDGRDDGIPPSPDRPAGPTAPGTSPVPAGSAGGAPDLRDCGAATASPTGPGASPDDAVPPEPAAAAADARGRPPRV